MSSISPVTHTPLAQPPRQVVATTAKADLPPNNKARTASPVRQDAGRSTAPAQHARGHKLDLTV